MFRSLLILAVLITANYAVRADDLTETHNKIKLAVEARQYSIAVAELRGLKAANARVFELNNYDYLLARMAESDGDTATAIATYQSVASRDSILKAYALFHLAKIFRMTGNLLLERLYLTKLSVETPNSRLMAAARARLARNSFETSNFAETIRVLTANNTETPAGRPVAAVSRFVREDNGLLAEAYLRNGQTSTAQEIFLRLLDETPDQAQPDDVALSAVRGLDLIENGAENFGKKVAELSEPEHLRRANV